MLDLSNRALAGFVTPTAHEKSEWSRMAGAAYSTGCNNAIGHRYSVAASLPMVGRMTVAYFDKLQSGYRRWLVDNVWPAE